MLPALSRASTRPMKTLRRLLDEMAGQRFDARQAFRITERRVKSIFIHAFMDPDTYDLSEEIALLRLYMRRLNLASQDETDPQKLERTLRTLSLASIAITRLFRAQLLAQHRFLARGHAELVRGGLLSEAEFWGKHKVLFGPAPPRLQD